MKKWFSLTAVLVAFLVAVVRAQDVAGVWQGTLQAQGRELRLQFRIISDAGTLKGTVLPIDQGPVQLPANVTVQAGTVKVVLPGINATFEGKLSADLSEIDGTWTQGLTQKLLLKKVTEQ